MATYLAEYTGHFLGGREDAGKGEGARGAGEAGRGNEGSGSGDTTGIARVSGGTCRMRLGEAVLRVEPAPAATASPCSSSAAAATAAAATAASDAIAGGDGCGRGGWLVQTADGAGGTSLSLFDFVVVARCCLHKLHFFYPTSNRLCDGIHRLGVRKTHVYASIGCTYILSSVNLLSGVSFLTRSLVAHQ